MGQKIKWALCKFCGREVKLNGAGSDATAFQRFVRGVVGAINPVSVELFREATDYHDMAYHIGPTFFKTPEEAQREADEAFFDMMHLAIKDPKSHSRLGVFNRGLVRSAPWYFEYQAWKFYKAVRLKGHEVYPKLSCQHKERVFIKGDVRDVELAAQVD
jgi:hypothetical protein